MADCLLTKSPGRNFTAATAKEIETRMLELRKKDNPAPFPIYKVLPKLKRLNELFVYSPETVELTNKTTFGNRKNGERAGCNHTEYRFVSVDGVQYFLHRIIWKMVHGSDPIGQIDHVNGEKLDNRIANLRDVSPLDNSRNRQTALSNTGFIGVSFCKKGRRYQANIGLNNRTKNLGYFISQAEAIAAREAAEREYYGEFAPVAGAA